VGKEGREIIHKPRNTFSQPKKLLGEKSFTVLLPNHINILWSYLSEALWDVPRTSPLYQLSIFLSGKRLFPGWAIFFSGLSLLLLSPCKVPSGGEGGLKILTPE